MLTEMTGRITQLGLSTCPICNGGTMRVWKYPATISIGGPLRAEGDPKKDAEANILFMVLMSCDLCGHSR